MRQIPTPHLVNTPTISDGTPYNPLHDDAQAMALVKRFKLNIAQLSGDQCQVFSPLDAGHILQADSKDLNRAVCECVAKLKTPRRLRHHAP
jgi:hypothetical protein